VLWIGLIALLPNRYWRWQLASFFVLLVLAVKFRLSARLLAVRAGLFAPFLALISVGLIWQPDAGLRIGNLAIKACLSLWIMTLLVQITSLTEFVVGLRTLRLPRLWVDLIGFLLRYFNVISDEWSRMQLARRARTFRIDKRGQAQLLAQALGLLFIRAYQRAERVHQAMLARGYTSR
jgi:cobalt/nickel transport system permease protein